MKYRGKLYLSEERIEELGFVRKGEGDDARDYWWEVDLSNEEAHADKVTLALDAYMDFQFEMPDYDLNIPVNFQSIQEVETFISTFKRPYNHAFAGMLDICEAEDETEMNGKAAAIKLGKIKAGVTNE